MAGFKIDVNKFKHESSDDNCTTLRHKDGHTITISHKALGKDARAQLEALKKASGSNKQEEEARETEQPRKHYAEGSQTPISTMDAAPVQPLPAAVPAQPVSVLPEDVAQKRDIYNNLATQQVGLNPAAVAQTGDIAANMKFGPDGSEPKQFNPELWQQAESAYAKKQLQDQEQQKAAAVAAVETNKARLAAGLPPVNAPEAMQEAAQGAVATPQAGIIGQSPQITGPGPGLEQAAAQKQAQANDPESMVHSGYQSQLAGLQQEAAARSQLGQEAAAVRQKQIDNQQIALSSYQNEYKKLEAERQAHMQDIKDNFINPEKYWTGDKDGNGSHSKIMSAIGMIVAGFNPTNSPNAAVNFMKYQMDKNLEAQAKNLDSRQNLLAANLRQFGNLKDATDMTRVMQNDILSNQLELAAAKAATPMAKAQLLQAAGKLKMETAPMFQQFAMRRALMNMSNSGDQSEGAMDNMISMMRVMNPEMAKEMQTRRVPGYGMATIPVPDAVRAKLEEHHQMNVAASDLLNFVKTHSTIVPGTPEYTVGAQKALALQSKIRENKLGTVYKEGEQHLLNKFVNENPAGAMKMLQTVPALKELIQANNRELQGLAGSYGLKVPKGYGTQALGPAEGATGTYKGQKVIFTGGKWTIAPKQK